MAAPAYADTPDDLVQQGETLAKAGRYSEAIDKFKAADRAQPSASHACLIALAYTRRELWPQAEIFLSRCREAPASELPEWVPLAEQQLAERLATVNVAPIELVVTPAGVPVELSVSSFAPDEVFGPRTIHLPPGHHVVTARAPGYPEIQQSIDVGNRAPQRVVIELHHEVTRPKPPGVQRVRSTIPWYVVGAGAVVTGVAVTYHATAYRRIHADLQTASDQGDYDRFNQLEPEFKNKQRTTIVLYGVGVATAITGLVLHYVGVGDQLVEVSPAPGGGIISLGWRR